MRNRVTYLLHSHLIKMLSANNHIILNYNDLLANNNSLYIIDCSSKGENILYCAFFPIKMVDSLLPSGML